MEYLALPIVLQATTFVLVLGIAVVMLKRVRNSQKKRGEEPGGIAGPSKE